MIEFDCADCGRHIFDLRREAPPADRRCSVCRWIVDYIPTEAQAQVRERMDVPLHLG